MKKILCVIFLMKYNEHTNENQINSQAAWLVYGHTDMKLAAVPVMFHHM